MRFTLHQLALVIALPTLAHAQCDDIFISEYVEGWSNNKAIELYNPTDAAIDLSDYRLERYSNGATTAQDNQKVDLSGTLNANSVVVVVLDKQDPDGVDYEAPVWDELAEAADLWVCPVYEENNTMYFNGNDAMVLRKISTNSPIDIFGKIGEEMSGMEPCGPATPSTTLWTASSSTSARTHASVAQPTSMNMWNQAKSTSTPTLQLVMSFGFAARLQCGRSCSTTSLVNAS